MAENLDNLLNIFNKDEESPKVVEGEIVNITEKKPEASSQSELDARTEKDILQDYNDARENLKALAKSAADALDGIMSLAQSADSPRAYEVVADLIKTATETNMKIIEMQSNMQAMKNTKAKKETNITNNSIFVGNTSDLLKFVKEKNLIKKPPKASKETDKTQESKE